MVPNIRHGGGDGHRSRPVGAGAKEWVEAIEASGDQEHLPRAKILHNETIRVKFNRAQIVASKLPNGNEICDYVWRNEDVAECEGGWRESGGAGGGDGEAMPIANKNGRRNRML